MGPNNITGAAQPGLCGQPLPGGWPLPQRSRDPFVVRYAHDATGRSPSPPGSGTPRSLACANRPPAFRHCPCSRKLPSWTAHIPVVDVAACSTTGSLTGSGACSGGVVSGSGWLGCTAAGFGSSRSGSCLAGAGEFAGEFATGTGSSRSRSSTTVCVFWSSCPGNSTRSVTISPSSGGPSRKIGTTSTTTSTSTTAPIIRSFNARSIMIWAASIAVPARDQPGRTIPRRVFCHLSTRRVALIPSHPTANPQSGRVARRHWQSAVRSSAAGTAR